MTALESDHDSEILDEYPGGSYHYNQIQTEYPDAGDQSSEI